MGKPRRDDAMAELLSGPLGAQSRAVDHQLRDLEIISSRLVLRIGDRQVSHVAARLTEADRELRRAITFLVPDVIDVVDEIHMHPLQDRPRGRRDTDLLPPTPPQRAGLGINSADTGSLDLALDALGLLAAVLASQPVTLFLTTTSLLNAAGRMRVWIRRRTASDPLKDISARDAIRIAQELAKNPSAYGEPELDLSLADTGPAVGPRKASAKLPDGTIISARTFTYSCRSAEGDEIFIHAEG